MAVYILDCGISSENVSRLTDIGRRYGCDPVFVNSSKKLDPEMKQNRGSLSTFARLYLEELLPDNIDKVIYLDCDVLVLGSLEELDSTDIDGYYCAGVRDCISMLRLKRDGLSDKDVYINAGVMVINLKLWRSDNVSAAFEHYSDKYNGKVQYADQGIINGVFKGRILPLDPRYNCYTAMYDFSYEELMIFRKPPVYYSRQEIETAKNVPSIVHFTTSFLSLRPWFEGCGHPYAQEWIKYRKKTSWADEPMKKCSEKPMGAAKAVFKIFPRKAAVAAAGFVHSIVVPVLKGVF